MKTKQTKQKEIARIKLSDNQDLVASLVDNEKLDLRFKFRENTFPVFMKTEKYQGPTKRGVRFYLFDDNWIEFKKLVETIEKNVSNRNISNAYIPDLRWKK